PIAASSLKQGTSTARRTPMRGRHSAAGPAIGLSLDIGRPFASVAGERSRRCAVRRTCPFTIAFLCSRVLPFGACHLAVIVPFEGHPPSTIDRLLELVAADMGHVNATILSRTGSEVAMIPEVANHLISSGGKRLRPILTLAMARLAGYPGSGHVKLAAAV